MEVFKVANANREPSVALDLHKQDGKEMYAIPHISEVKEYGKTLGLNYVVPRFLGYTDYYICTCYKKKGKPDTWVTQINPLILSTEGLVFVEETQEGVEGTYLVPRHPRILVAYTEAGTLNPVQRELMGLAALQFQQAVHAANGIFISDFGLRVDNLEAYINGTDEEKEKIAENYFKALKETVNGELDKDDKLKEYVRATEFLAENVEMDNAKQGVLPADIERKLNEEADVAENDD